MYFDGLFADNQAIGPIENCLISCECQKGFCNAFLLSHISEVFFNLYNLGFDIFNFDIHINLT